MRKFRLLVMVLFIIALLGCEKDVEKKQTGPDAALEAHVNFIMTDIYYWYDKVPTGLSMGGEKNVFSFFNALLWEKDRWSWMMTAEDFNASETGIYVSYGVSIAQPIEYFNDYSIMIQYVHPNSPFDDKGVKRGWTITHIGGVDTETLIRGELFSNVFNQSPNKFTFKDNLGKQHIYDMTAREITTKSYLVKDVYTSADFPGLPHSVGYFNYLTFNFPMQDEIDEAFAEFHTAGVKDIILDLRYNGGGDTRPMALLANYLAPSSANGKALARKKHNDKYSSRDKDDEVIERKDNALNIDRVFIISGYGSASASEVIINGLSPFFGKESIIQVGDTTYGKPNGMYVLPFPEGPTDTQETYFSKAEYIFLPICFFTVNSQGYGDYLDGIIPDHYRPDDLYNDWGVEEDLIKACLTYIKDGTLPALPPRPKSSRAGLDSRKLKVQTPQDKPGYGLYLDRLN